MLYLPFDQFDAEFTTDWICTEFPVTHLFHAAVHGLTSIPGVDISYMNYTTDSGFELKVQCYGDTAYHAVNTFYVKLYQVLVGEFQLAPENMTFLVRAEQHEAIDVTDDGVDDRVVYEPVVSIQYGTSLNVVDYAMPSEVRMEAVVTSIATEVAKQFAPRT